MRFEYMRRSTVKVSEAETAYEMYNNSPSSIRIKRNSVPCFRSLPAESVVRVF